MKLHMRSVEGSALALAYRWTLEEPLVPGLKVTASIFETEHNARDQHKGMLRFHHNDWRNRIDDKTVVVYDFIGCGEEAQELIDSGVPVIGASRFCDRLELDRNFAMEWTAQHGIPIPKTWHFSDYEEAKDFIKNYDGRLIFKPFGSLPSEMTYMSQDSGNMDLLYKMDRLKDQSGGEEFILQEVVEGIEISLEGWYYKGELLPGSLTNTLEEKKLMNDSLGPTVGCAGSIIWSGPFALYMYDKTLRLLEESLKQEEYTGVLDINTIFVPEEQTFYALEYCPRFGFAGYQNTSALIQPFYPLSRLYWEWGMGQLSMVPIPTNVLSMAVIVTIPRSSKDGTVPIEEYIGGTIDDRLFWWSDVKAPNGQLVTAGVDGIVGVAVVTGLTLEECRAKVYDQLDRLVLSNKQYRTDIGSRYERDFPTLCRIEKKMQRQPTSQEVLSYSSSQA